MQTVKCFKRDHWCDVDVFEMKEGDIFARGGQTYVTTGKPFIDENGKPNVSADLYDSGPIRIAVGIKGQDFIHMAMDFVGSGDKFSIIPASVLESVVSGLKL